ncbi:hypothetical protein [Turicibacter bilis]|uniref:hypothetical protein n=1 Tax=Turicibacter bilis TaxID=2735723 RepID=UPI003F8A10BD
MIINIFLIFAIAYLIRQISNQALKKQVMNIFLIASFFQIIFLILYRIELYQLDRVVYYSDAEVYWEETLNYLNGNITDAYNASYIWTCWLLQKTSPFISVIWNNMYNILVMDLSILISALVIIHNKNYINSNVISQTRVFLILNLFNPLILFGYMRNLKDASFLLYISLTIYLLQKLNQKRHILKEIFYCIFLGIMAVVSYGIRPWAFVISIYGALAFLFSNNKFNKLRSIMILLFIGCFCIIAAPQIIRIYDSTILWTNVIENRSQGMGILELVKSMATLLLGPGYLRSLLGHRYFLFYMIIGNIMCFIGSIIWWIQIPYMISMVKKPRISFRKASIYLKYYFIMTISYILIYSISYRGSTEIRMRSTLYILISTIFFGIFDYKLNKTQLLLFGCGIVVIFIGGSIIGF